MIKSMVVAIDSTESSARAQEYALTLAKRYNAELTGIAVLDVPWITAPMATPRPATRSRPLAIALCRRVTSWSRCRRRQE